MMGSTNNSDLPPLHNTFNPEDGMHPNKVELYVVMTYLSFLSVMGTGGNALVLYVFSQKKDKLVSTLFIIVLAFVDFITCLAVIPYTIYMEYVEFIIQYDFFCKLYQFLITSNIPFSALIMVAIAIDRYLCICHPFLHAMNICRAKVIIACLALFAITLGVVVALIYSVYSVGFPEIPLPSENYTLIGLNATTQAMVGDLHKVHINTGISKTTGFYNLHSNTMGNLTATTMTTGGTIILSRVYFTGKCAATELVWSKNFQNHYQKFYMSLFIVCLIIVIILYSLIYKSVLARRSKRQKQKSKSLSMVLSSQATILERNGDSTPATEETLLTTVNGDSKVETTVAVKNGPSASSSKEAKSNRKSIRKDRHRMANLKTAAMLFVVTAVFIVTFIPAYLMALRFINYKMIVFYLYFANNVANPVIYSFMNKNFRDDLRRLFCRER